MHTMDDRELLEAYARNRSESAFGELVGRHLPWVYSVALRHVGSASLAEDVAQSVFILLAKKAGSLRSGTILAGWLFRTTRFVANRALRAEQRRKCREQTAAVMKSSTTVPDDTELYWERVAPHLDQAVAALSETDRAAILLRFYEKKPLLEVGRKLGLSEEAAKKRVSRAIEKMRSFLSRRGVAVGGMTLAALMAEQTVEAVPATMPTGVCKAAVAAGSISGVLPQLAQETLNAWRWAKIKLLSAGTVSGLLLLFSWQQFVVNRGNSADAGQSETAMLVGTTNQPGTPTVSAQLKTATNTSTVGLLFQVVAADTGRGIKSARVLVNHVVGMEWRGKELITDNDGYCQVPLPEGDLGRLDVGVLKDGFVERFYTWRQDYGMPIPSLYVLKLARAASIGGHVQDASGSPVMNAEIGLSFHGTGDAIFREPTLERLGFVGNSVTAVKTDARGNWRCALTPPAYADFSIDVRHPSFIQRTFVPTVGAQQPQDATRLRMEDLWSGKAVMVLEPGFQLQGFVLDQAGNPVEGARVSQMGDSNYRQDGVRTGKDGSFRLTSLPPGAQRISAWAKGFAPCLLTIEGASQNGDVVFRLGRGTQFPLRMVDEDGMGIPGAWAVIDLPFPHNADFQAISDSQGRACFTGVPTNAFGGLLFHAGARGYFCARNVRLSSEQSEPLLHLIKSLRVSGNVEDAQTHERILEFKAIPCRGEGVAGYDRAETRKGQWGAYQVEFSEPGGPFRVRIEAEGYEPAMSPAMADHPPEQQQDFLLRRVDANKVLRGVVVGPDGRPAANVGVALLTFEQGVTLYNGTFKRSDGALLTTTDEHGQFKFAADPQAHTLVAADPVEGFALLRMHRSVQPFTLSLRPWGRIEGRVVLSGAPAPNQQVFISSGMSAYRSIRDGLYTGFDFIRTDSEGRFVCDLVPPGDFTLHLSQGSGQPLSHARVTEVRAGETVQVQIGGIGRTVTGRLRMSDGSKVDWPRQLITGGLATDLKPPSVQPPADSHDFAERVRILDFFDDSQEWRAYERMSGSFPLQVAADGTFTVPDVPPGPYELRARIADSPNLGGDFLHRVMSKISASVKEAVVVPEAPDSSGVVDLGTFILRPNSSISSSIPVR